MATKRLPRPRDPVQLAKLIGDIATGQVHDEVDTKADGPTAVELGRKGGQARARRLTPKQRQEASRLAAEARWKKSP
jgi:hypothetical protein